MTPVSNSVPVDSPTRREALRRAALLLGVAFTPSILAAATAGLTPPVATGETSRLGDPERALLAALAERLLPRTDTPGALDAGVPAFIERMVNAYFTDRERERFFAGLSHVDALSRSRLGDDFVRLRPDQQDTVLAALADAAVGQGVTFYSLVREATIVGYFTSELVGKTVLHYDPVPGRFDACIPISEVGNVAWTR